MLLPKRLRSTLLTLPQRRLHNHPLSVHVRSFAQQQGAPDSSFPRRNRVTKPLNHYTSTTAQPTQSLEPEEPVLAVPPHYALHRNEVHCFLGLNGSGKSRLLQQLLAQSTRKCRVETLSLDAHREFVAQYGDRIVANVLGGVASPDARDLIVRLGLYPVWESHVRHLSTGEIRKVMLAVALLRVPKASVLLMDQPFDGLDVAARKQLEWMLGQLTRGFTRLLVNTGGRNEAFAYKTQVVLVANRLEQVFQEILSHMVLLKKPVKENEELATVSTEVEIVSWDDSENPDAMLQRLHEFLEDEDQKRPKMEEEALISLVQQLFGEEGNEDEATNNIGRNKPGIELQQVFIAYDDKRTLLENVDFVRQRHQHWALLGPNGSGKSSLMRVLMQTPGHGLQEGQVYVNGVQLSNDKTAMRPVEAISTDQHIQLLQQHIHDDHREARTAFDLIVENAASLDKAHLAAQLLNLPSSIFTRALTQLSQGEQKLVLIARVIASCPSLLILDEITHGLDPFNRAHVLRVIDAIGKYAAHATHLILITHHEDEITECFSSIYEIIDKQLIERSAKTAGKK